MPLRPLPFALSLLAVLLLTHCGPSAADLKREAEINAKVSRSLIESRHHWEPSGSMTGPGNQ